MMPLCNGVSISVETSSWAIMQFGISKNLTYSTTLYCCLWQGFARSVHR